MKALSVRGSPVTFINTTGKTVLLPPGAYNVHVTGGRTRGWYHGTLQESVDLELVRSLGGNTAEVMFVKFEE